MTFEGAEVNMPAPPRPWGPRPAPSILYPGVGSLRGLGDYAIGPLTSPGYTATNGGSTTIEYDPFHLRPHKTHDLDGVPLVVGSTEQSTLTGTWVATARNRDGRAEGTVTVQLDQKIVTVINLMGGTG
jgi:hypothetical protein